MATVPPENDQALAVWTDNFSTRIGLTPTVFDLTAAQATAYAAARLAFVNALGICDDPGTRTKSAIAQRNALKAVLLTMTRQLLAQVGACPTLSAAQRVDLGMNPARNPHPARRPVPATRPVVFVDDRGNVRLADEAAPTVRRKPANVAGAYLYVAVLPADAPPPAGPEDGTHFTTMVTATRTQVAIPPGSFGKTLYIFARWCNARGAAGPTSLPASVTVAVLAA
jgi:hypothetical protein